MSFVMNIKNERCVFLHIPKNGGKSIIKALNRFNPNRPDKRLIFHHTYLETKNIVQNNDDLYFCTIRNPWKRMVSFYHFLAQTDPRRSGCLDMYTRINNGLNFADFVENYINDDRKLFRPQIEYIIDENSKICVNCLIMDNNINKNLNEFLKEIGVEKKIKMTQINKSIHFHYTKYYDSQELIDKVHKYEMGVIEKFGFEFKK